MFLHSILIGACAVLLVVGSEDLSAQENPLADSTDDAVRVTPSRVDDLPPGTNWVADGRTRTYYRAGCPATASIPQRDRSHYASDSLLQAVGYIEGECSSSAPNAEASRPPSGVMPTPISPPASAAPAVASREPAPKEERSRQGFWFNVGAGFGSLGCEDCSGRDGSYSGGLALGGAVSQKVVLGVGTNGWYKSDNGVTVSAGTLTALIRFYPSSTGGFFLLGGIGAGTVHLDAGIFGSATETGGGALVGLGYDIRVGKNISLTPYWNGFAAKTSNFDANVGQIGLGLTIH
jgi:hypothetical protein